MVNRREKVNPLVDHEVGKGWLEANHRNAPWLNVKIWCSTPKKVKMQVLVAQHPNKRLSASCDPVPKPGFLVAANFNRSELLMLSAGATHHVDHHSPLLDPRWIHLVLFLRSSPGCLSKCLSSHKRQLWKRNLQEQRLEIPASNVDPCRMCMTSVKRSNAMLGGFLNVQTLQTAKHLRDRKQTVCLTSEIQWSSPILLYPEMLLRVTWHSQDHNVSFFDCSLRPKEQSAAEKMGGMSCEKLNFTLDDCVNHLQRL